MKKANLLKALIIAVPVLIAVFASYTENKKQNAIIESYKSDMISSRSIELGSNDLTK